jgi:hypothetical protein
MLHVSGQYVVRSQPADDEPIKSPPHCKRKYTYYILHTTSIQTDRQTRRQKIEPGPFPLQKTVRTSLCSGPFPRQPGLTDGRVVTLIFNPAGTTEDEDDEE